MYQMEQKEQRNHYLTAKERFLGAQNEVKTIKDRKKLDDINAVGKNLEYIPIVRKYSNI